MLKQIPFSGWWSIAFDETDQGRQMDWASKPPACTDRINVPSCWNEVFPERFHYEGVAWYFREFTLTAEDFAPHIRLHFEGVNYRSEIYLNGTLIGCHEGGFTEFSFPVTQALKLETPNLLSVRVDSRLGADTLPPSGVDWFNYGGIYRPLSLQFSGTAFVEDLTLKTRMDGTLTISTRLSQESTAGRYQLVQKVTDPQGRTVVETVLPVQVDAGRSEELRSELHIPEAHLWNLGAPYLYTLSLEFLDADDRPVDRLSRRFGIREFGRQGSKILINGQEVKLVGCAKHDEYPLTGRAVTREQLIKDYDLLRQMNANLVRLSHYPHSRLEHEILDELGMAAISEIPMVFLREAQMTSADIREKSLKMLDEMIAAEKNTTSIMFWSLFIECETDLASTRPFVEAMVEATRSLDDTRLVIMASNRPLTDVTYDLFDVVGVNYWEGWYDGKSVEDGIRFLEAMAARYPDKPLLITSHGWEGLYGRRSYVERTPWSEDSQSDYLARIADVYMSFKNIVGEVIWTFADFRVTNWRDVSEDSRSFSYLGRPELVNHKGMVDFYRRPKSTYYVMKDKFARWQEKTAPAVLTCGTNLQVSTYSDRRLAGEAAAGRFIDQVNELLLEKESIHVLFASAGSQVEFLDSLLRNRTFVDWGRIHAFHLDEFVGAGESTPYGFACWIKSHLIDALPFASFHALDGQADDLAAECSRYAGLLSRCEIDLACIGIGENGHLAFNDPPVANFNDPELVKVIELDPACREQQFRDGVFPDLESVPERALTLTIPAILRASHILCIVPGTHKAVPVWKTIYNPVATECPATILREHADVRLYLDSDSAELILKNLNGKVPSR